MKRFKYKKVFEDLEFNKIKAPSLFIYKPLIDSFISIVLRVLGVFIYGYIICFYFLNDFTLTLRSENEGFFLFEKIYLLNLLFVLLNLHIYLGFKHSYLKNYYLIKTTINTPFMNEKYLKRGNANAYLVFYRYRNNLKVNEEETAAVAANIRDKRVFFKIFMFRDIGFYYQIFALLELILSKFIEYFFFIFFYIVIFYHLILTHNNLFELYL